MRRRILGCLDEVGEFPGQRLQAIQVDIALNVGVAIGSDGNDHMIERGHAGVAQLRVQVLAKLGENPSDGVMLVDHGGGSIPLEKGNDRCLQRVCRPPAALPRGAWRLFASLRL